MYQTDLEASFIDAIKQTGQFDVRGYAFELANAANVKRLHSQLGIKPVALVDVGEPSAEPALRDTTGQVTRDTVPVQVIVAWKNLRDPMVQKRECRDWAWAIRRLFQGGRFEADNFTNAQVVFINLTHNGTTDGMTLYSVWFEVSGDVDITA